MKRIHSQLGARRESDMCAVADGGRLLVVGQLDPEARSRFAIGDRVGHELHDALVAKRTQHGIIKSRCALDVSDADGNVMKHERCSPWEGARLLRFRVPRQEKSQSGLAARTVMSPALSDASFVSSSLSRRNSAKPFMS